MLITLHNYDCVDTDKSLCTGTPTSANVGMGVSASRSREVCRECKDVCVACGGGACVWTCVTPATCSEPQFEYVITPTDHGAVVQVQPAFPPKFELEAAWNSGCRDGGGGRVSV